MCDKRPHLILIIVTSTAVPHPTQSGAVVGAYTFGYLSEITSLYFVFFCSAGFSVCGIMLTYFFLPPLGFRPSGKAKGIGHVVAKEDDVDAGVETRLKTGAGERERRNIP